MPTLRDLLDILLVTVLIYQLLLLIRGTRAVQLALGRAEPIRLVSDVARAARVLSIRKTGALVVLERNTGLTDVVETGIRVDATVTVPLLLRIFYPTTPLHEGAGILRGNRVLAVGGL